MGDTNHLNGTSDVTTSLSNCDVMMPLKEIEFYKYHGAGNEFIVIDNRDGRYTEFLSNHKLVKLMCRRHFGIDADGIVEIKLSKDGGLVFSACSRLGPKYNMCGNGSRIFVTHVKNFGIHTGTDDVTFLAGDGIHHGNYDVTTREAWASIVDIPASSVKKISDTEYIVNTGLAHMVTFVDYDVTLIDDANKHGEEMTEKWKRYASGAPYILINYVTEKDGVLYSRCCNWNVDHEIISCGTATAAIGVSYAMKSGCATSSDFEAKIQWPGGLMKCLLHRDTTTFSKLRISGPIRQVYKGTFYTDSME